ncbi:glycosyltransferase family 2 protein [Aerosakkonema funiforme]|uniref:Glycosyltransferase family 2 protein n=2 Tax=Oscillatoriophycideae TaxID=1301283 RepID=A0A926VLA1_9CYAN|nr:glycosyltransferase family 2 protein [Aerosakkonema funiforme]MBD2184529.1 glycosyltransferase family 2 protein [Aerosakkonema funiforme FACHB-1375]
MSVISAIIPVRNRKNYTQNILTQIYSQLSNKNYQKKFNVIVVDDGSTDGTKELIRSQFSEVNLLEADGSLWWTGAICQGMNYAIEVLNSDYIVWLNDDISISEDLIDNIKEICDSPLSKEAIIGGIVRERTYPDWVVFSGMLRKKLIRSMDHFVSEKEIIVDTLNGNIAVIPRTVVEKIGLPDAVRFRHYGGDFEFVSRAKKCGFKVILSSRLQATTDCQIADFVRYMPPWMQWRIENNIFKKIKILQGFTNLKFHHNIWHMLNIIYWDYKHIPSWKYINFYVRQVIKVIASDFWLRSRLEGELQDYFKEQNAPQPIIDAIMSEISRK